MNVEGSQEWLDRYVAAWLSYDRDEIAALFSEDVTYRYHPYDEAVVGRDAVVRHLPVPRRPGRAGRAHVLELLRHAVRR